MTSGSTRLKSVSYTYTEIAPDQKYTFNITATDGDGDVTAAQVLSIQQTSMPTTTTEPTGGSSLNPLNELPEANAFVLI